MIIGIDASRANKKIKSGTEYYSYYLIRNLAKIDSQNKYILYTNEPLTGGLLDLTTEDDEKAEYQDVEFDKNGFQIINSPHGNFKVKILKWPFNNFWTLGRLTLEMVFNKPECLFVPAHSLPLIFPAKTINTIHDIAFEKDHSVYDQEIITKNNRKVKKIINYLVYTFTFGKYQSSALDHLKWSTRITLKKASKIITVSSSSKKEIVDFYHLNDKQKNKIEVIYNGFNDVVYKKINDQGQINKVLKKYNIEKPYILYVGRLEKKKNTPALIEAFASSKQRVDKKLKLVLLGFDSFGSNEVKYLINDLDLEEDVIMPGWIPELDIPSIYSGAEAFIFPSKHEGFGIPIIQAMNCGTPVACSDIPVLREIAKDAALFFCPYNKESISAGIDRIVSDQELQEDLISKGFKRAQQFNWRKCAEETLRVINDC